MGRVNDDKWLDKTLDKAIHSDDTRPDFDTWVANHPEAVKSLTSRTPQTRQPLRIRRIIMNATFVKLAAAAVIAVAAIVGIAKFTQNPADNPPLCHYRRSGDDHRADDAHIRRRLQRQAGRGRQHPHVSP